MKNRYHQLAAALLLAFLAGPLNPLSGQCNFDAEIILAPEAPQNVYCPYDSVKLSVAEPFDSYQWYYNFSGDPNSLTPLVGATQSSVLIPIGEFGFGYFFVELTRDDCTEVIEPVVIDSWVFSPVAVQHDPQDTYCNGDSTMVSNAFGAYASYQWLRNGEPIPGATGPQYVVKESGEYVLNASPFECPLITLTSGIGPYFTFIGPTVPSITEEDGLLHANSTGPGFQWALDGVDIPEATGPSYQPAISGVYTVRASDGSGCSPLSEPYTFQLTGLRQPAPWAGEFGLFPNPAGEKLTITGPAEARYELRLANALGQEVLRLRQQANGPMELPLGQLAEGAYVLQIFFRGEMASYPVVVAR